MNIRIVYTAMIVSFWISFVYVVTLPAAEGQHSMPNQREFEFNYETQVTGLAAGDEVQLWLPIAQNTPHQQIEIAGATVPGKITLTDEPKYGNRILWSSWTAENAEPAQAKITYHVVRHEVLGRKGHGKRDVLTSQQRKLFTSASAKIPTSGKPAELLKSQEAFDNDFLLAEDLYLRVDRHMTYDKSKPGYGTGDAVWACDSRYGNCTDFHSLFISLARIKGLPARFEIGFPLPEKRGTGTVGGYHCWAYVYTEKHGWTPVDISEADKHPEMKNYYFGNLTENRMVFTVGRDINLVPKQVGPPLNFFVYPYVEVNGKPWPGENIEPSFSFRDR